VCVGGGGIPTSHNVPVLFEFRIVDCSFFERVQLSQELALAAHPLCCLRLAIFLHFCLELLLAFAQLSTSDRNDCLVSSCALSKCCAAC
jgi:hypothetical protein